MLVYFPSEALLLCSTLLLPSRSARKVTVVRLTSWAKILAFSLVSLVSTAANERPNQRYLRRAELTGAVSKIWGKSSGERKNTCELGNRLTFVPSSETT